MIGVVVNFQAAKGKNDARVQWKVENFSSQLSRAELSVENENFFFPFHCQAGRVYIEKCNSPSRLPGRELHSEGRGKRSKSALSCVGREIDNKRARWWKTKIEARRAKSIIKKKSVGAGVNKNLPGFGPK